MSLTETRFSFSDRALAALPLGTSGQRIVRDLDLPGFFVLIGTRSKAFMIQGDLWAHGKRQTIRVKIGNVTKITTREARAKAKVVLGSIANGCDPRCKPEQAANPQQNPADPLLREAWAQYRDGHMTRKGRSAGTIESYRDHVERLLVDWLDQPLSALSHEPSLVKARHDKLTEENGPYIANGCMRTLRAIYNHARKTARSLPADNPVNAVDWNPEKRRNTALGFADLAPWFKELSRLNPLRREFHLFLLLSGSRPDAIKRARTEHLDLSRRLLHIPKPKGGEDKAFDIPLSRDMIRCLVRAMRIGRQMYPVQASDWLFPADSATGHIVEHKEDRAQLSKWGNDLRQTYRTIAQAVGINDVDMHLLMNHSLPGINAGYITRNKLLGNHLRSQQQLISTAVFRASRNGKSDQAPTAWPWLSSRGHPLTPTKPFSKISNSVNNRPNVVGRERSIAHTEKSWELA
jgi:integrase